MQTPLTFHASDFPNMATHVPQTSCGFSIYRGTLIQWDEDHDERILGVIDRMPAHIVDQLLIAQEHEGNISFVWSVAVPHGYEQGKDVVALDHGSPPEEDYWVIHTSQSV